ncbi:MAG TPA: hypothetical protein ENN41_09260, partial [Sediminispirochaeta sp.]|nr:hypothetical protein [Sediminispirochaeta sp.]
MIHPTEQRDSSMWVLSIAFLYVILIVLILVFAQQLLGEISQGTSLGRYFLIPLAIFLPLFLLSGIVYNVIRLIRQRRDGLPGSRFKVKLVLFFTLLSLLASVPQGVLSISFIRTTMDSWFSEQLHSSLKGGLDIALTYNRESLTGLSRLAGSSILPDTVREHMEDPEELWANLQSFAPDIDAIQVYDQGGREVLFVGDSAARMEELPSSLPTGTFPRIKQGDLSLLRARSSVNIDDSAGNVEKYTIVSTLIMPLGFDRKAQDISEALRMFSQYSDFHNTFFLAILVFYSMFSFPILLLSILVGFLLSEEITRPIVHLE